MKNEQIRKQVDSGILRAWETLIPLIPNHLPLMANVKNSSIEFKSFGQYLSGKDMASAKGFPDLPRWQRTSEC